MIRRRRLGVSSVEMIGLLGGLGVLTALLMPALGVQVERARSARIARDLWRLEAAVTDFRADTNRWPIQYSNYDPAVHPDVMNLTVRPTAVSGIRGWDGPYLADHWPKANNWGGRVDLLDSTYQFDLNGDRTPDTSGSNSYLYLTRVPEPAAREIDRLIDGGGSERSGRVTYAPAGRRRSTVYIFLAD
jgi:type II secretory pathway pseudopilin PulG